MSEFVSVADAASLPPGHGRTVHANGRPFALWNVEGEIFCLDDTCPHRGGPLGAGTLEEGFVCCPLHGWAFDVRTGDCRERQDKSVKCYPTRIVEGQVQVMI